MNIKHKKWVRFRIYVAALFFLFGFGSILARAYQLQVLEKDHLRAIAREGYIGTVRLPPKRGIIYDRDRHELAVSVKVESVYAHPIRIKEKVKTAGELAQILKTEPAEIMNVLRTQRSFAWIQRRIDPILADEVKALDLDGVGVTIETRRYYPGKEIAAHLIGFVGDDNEGLEGIEKGYERLLRGSQDDLIQMRDALGRPFSISKPHVSGDGMHDIVLTIDREIQYKAQQALAMAVKKAEAKSGHCLVVDPNTGEVLAMAVVPEFNPNIFTRYEPDQWRNRTVTDCFEPGSTMKAFLLAAALEEQAVTTATEFDCENGIYSIGPHVIHDTRNHGILTVSDIIIHSSNIGAVKIGQKLGYSKYYNYLRRLGFGSKTGIGLLGERSGFVRSPGKAGPVDQATLFFGQGMSTTSLQMVMAMSAIANGGKLMRPYVVRSIMDESGKVVKEIEPKILRRIFSFETTQKVSRILEGVVSRRGTGAQAAIRGFSVAGKTGTAQKVNRATGMYSEEDYVATFFGYVPVENPKLAILVVIDEPQGIPYSSEVAAPVFRQVGLWSLNYLGINPFSGRVGNPIETDIPPERYPSHALLQTRRPLILNSESLPDFKGLGMREVLRIGRSLGIEVLLEGTGLAVEQYPGPGSSLKRIKTVRVCFRPPT
jgi:cell division protein FtsI (penicillin-binding protein 3)